MANSTPSPRQYELMSILIPDMPEEETQAAIERVKGYIADANATVSQVLTDSPWGRRRLAYEMRYAGVDYRDGFYVLTYFSAVPEALPEIEREMRLDTQVIRYLLVTDDPKAGEKPGLQGEGGEEAADVSEGAAAPAAESAQPAPAESAPQAPAADAPAETEAESTTDSETAAETAPAAEATADTAVEDTADAIEGEEAPAPADAPAEEAAEAPAAKRSNKLPNEGEGSDWVAGDGTNSIPDGFPIKGNASSKIYHPQESPNYSNTVAEIYFANGEAAERFGYRLPKTLQNAGAAAGAGLSRSDDASEEE